MTTPRFLSDSETLFIAGEQLIYVLGNLEQFTKLRRLYINGNPPTSLPDSLAKLTQLEFLSLDNNRLTHLPDWLGELSQLKHLSLSNNRLAGLPDWLEKFTRLRSLSLDYNQLTRLPDWLGELSQLTHLSLSNNQLAGLPDWLGKLPQLTSLSVSLSGNQLARLPDSLRQLTQLEFLALSFDNNQLTSLPDWLGELPQLRSLSFNNNQLTQLPDWLGELTCLTSLILSNNQLAHLPDSLGQLTQLQLLALDNNRLTSLPDWLEKLTLLRNLSLSKNWLTRLPDWLGKLTLLRSLSLSGNQLTRLPDSLGELTQLGFLALDDNLITSLPNSLGELTQLKFLSLSGNQLTHLPDSLGQFTQLTRLFLNDNQLTHLPDSLGQLTQLTSLSLTNNQLTHLPDSLGQLTQLTDLPLKDNRLTHLPDSLGLLTSLTGLSLDNNQLTSLPAWLGQLAQLEFLSLANNQITSLPDSLGQLPRLKSLGLVGNPLLPEWAAVYEDSTEALLSYLRAEKTPLYEAKLVLVGEGEVGKSCLLSALLDEPFQPNRPTTHGIEVKSVLVSDPDTGHQLTLNTWDFGGQPVYRPTHQLFFSAPALYLIVWKPRHGPQQGAVEDWIRMVKYRAPEAQILVVATHGGPGQRLPDLDEHALRSRFGADTILGFHVVDSDSKQGLPELKRRLSELAAALPEMGRRVPTRWQQARQALSAAAEPHSQLPEWKARLGELAATVPEIGKLVPASWQQARHALHATSKPYMRLSEALELCQQEAALSSAEAERFVNVAHELGQLVHYQHDAVLSEVVILKPDWLTKALSFVLDDKDTREKQGLVEYTRLQALWHDQQRPKEERYPAQVHPMFLRLMERYELSYRIADAGDGSLETSTSLIAQLVPDTAPDLTAWTDYQQLAQQTRLCRIVEREGGQSATAEGLFFRLLVRLHRYSLGREHYPNSVHWKRGMVLDADYNGRALLEHIGNDIRITVKAALPGTLLDILTDEVKWLVEYFWKGLRCNIMVPCLPDQCPRRPDAGSGWVEQEKLVNFRSRYPHMSEYQCPEAGCEAFLNINRLFSNVTASLPKADPQLTNLAEQVKIVVEAVSTPGAGLLGRFDNLDDQYKISISQADANFNSLLLALDDEARDVPRLFSLTPAERGTWDWPRGMLSRKFHLTLWCEHARLPLH